MTKPVLFISDLHLDPSRPAVTQAFCSFLANAARESSSLYILGDLFEYWIGDDQPKFGVESVIFELKVLTDSGVPVFFICGNRDFLLGSDFAASTGIELLDDEVVVDLFGTRTVILHGDTLCTDDVDYLSLRSMLRNEAWQSEFLGLSIENRVKQAQALRDQSQKETKAKSEYITDVNQQAVEECMSRHAVSRMIHGHTHRPAVHEFELSGEAAQRVVLGDWYDQGSVLRVDEKGLELSVLGINNAD